MHCAVTQANVVTQEPGSSIVDETLEHIFMSEVSRFAKGKGRAGDDGAVLIEADGPDLPENFKGNFVDI